MIDLWFEFVNFNGLLGFIVIFLYLFLILCVKNVWLKWGIFLRIFYLKYSYYIILMFKDGLFC